MERPDGRWGIGLGICALLALLAGTLAGGIFGAWPGDVTLGRTVGLLVFTGGVVVLTAIQRRGGSI